MNSISFNPAMLAAVLAGRKTVTRRRLSPLLTVQQDPARYRFRHLTEAGACFENLQQPGEVLPPVSCPFGQAGTVLRVQEAPGCLLQIVSLHLEQVCSLTELQARAEGIRFRQQPGQLQWGGVELDAQSADGFRWYGSALQAFQALFDGIYPGAWARNEWVWVVEFAQVAADELNVVY